MMGESHSHTCDPETSFDVYLMLVYSSPAYAPYESLTVIPTDDAVGSVVSSTIALVTELVASSSSKGTSVSSSIRGGVMSCGEQLDRAAAMDNADNILFI